MTASQWEIDGLASGDWTHIGGHSNAQGAMAVYRTPDGIVKATQDEYSELSLSNEMEALGVMSGSGFAPEPLHSMADKHLAGPRYASLQADAGVSEPITDGEAFRRGMIKLVGAMRHRRLRHGDLTEPNLVIRGNHPVAIDWQESHWIADKGPQKQPWTDSFMAMRDVAGIAAADGQMDTPRVARRWLAVLTELGATIHRGGLPLEGQAFVDFGCFMGDFPALAVIEGMVAAGVDAGGFRTGENSIKIGRGIWEDLHPHPPVLFESNIFDWVADNSNPFEVTMMFSTFPYLVQQQGWEAAERLVSEIIARSGVFFFECQLAGDGPGPERFQVDGNIARWLEQWGDVKALVTIPVTGRPASRTVFSVR
ncbi:hypothetical protein LCGC14_1292820 [marine sediment metagenome]|uniref:Uncharacterized protein n=1 Tax=marine sediment metagenome TaxID=412755 RepID=A0A0F9KS50_9ZZZZ